MFNLGTAMSSIPWNVVDHLVSIGGENAPPQGTLCLYFFAMNMLPSLKLTVRTWKWMVGMRSFPFGMAHFQVRLLLVSGRVVGRSVYVDNLLPASSSRDLDWFPKWRSAKSALKRSRLWIQTRSRLEEPGTHVVYVYIYNHYSKYIISWFKDSKPTMTNPSQ